MPFLPRVFPSLHVKKQTNKQQDRLDQVIKRKADMGVRVFILPWQETKLAVDLGSDFVQKTFTKLSRNVFVVRHPSTFPLFWTHHMKIVVVDQVIAIVGGLDLTFGRYDTPEHRLSDPCELSTTWPGRDYYCPDLEVFCNTHAVPAMFTVDRLSVPRMGWHDIACAVTGDAAREVAWTFIQRWQHHVSDLGITGVPLAVPALSEERMPIPEHAWEAAGESPMLVDCHAVRSMCAWSGSIRTERSYEQAYIAAIARSERFVYLENQYFISLMQPGVPHNGVAAALHERIRRAILQRQVFRVIVLLPCHPEGPLSSASTLIVFNYEFETICRGPKSLIGELSREFPGVDLSQYITFSSLRKFDALLPGPAAPVVQNMVYVHSKLLLVDDTIAIIGSANVNDRSLLGDRDSEFGIVFDGGEQTAGLVAGKRVTVSTFVQSLRLKLWQEHLGLADAELDQIADAASPEAYELWRSRAATNLATYVRVFGNAIPHNALRLLNQVDMARWCQLPGISPADAREILSKVRGHVIEFPLDFLKDQDMMPGITSPESMIEASVFQ